MKVLPHLTFTRRNRLLPLTDRRYSSLARCIYNDALVTSPTAFRRARVDRPAFSRTIRNSELFWFNAHSDIFTFRAALRSLWNFPLSEYRDAVKGRSDRTTGSGPPRVGRALPPFSARPKAAIFSPIVRLTSQQIIGEHGMRNRPHPHARERASQRPWNFALSECSNAATIRCTAFRNVRTVESKSTRILNVFKGFSDKTPDSVPK
jgi:hypothetical protein